MPALFPPDGPAEPVMPARSQLADSLLTPSEVSELLRISTRHLRRLSVPCVRIGRLVRYRRGDVFRWVEARRTSA